jgi:hypothetical protein
VEVGLRLTALYCISVGHVGSTVCDGILVGDCAFLITNVPMCFALLRVHCLCHYLGCANLNSNLWLVRCDVATIGGDDGGGGSWWWEATAQPACGILLLAAAINFIGDALCYMLDWYLTIHRPIDKAYQTPIDECTWLTPHGRRLMTAIRAFDIRIIGDLLFLIGSVLYVCSAAVWLWWEDEVELYFWFDLFASHIFVLDSLVYLVEALQTRYSYAPDDRYLWFGGWRTWRDWVYADFETLGDVLFLFGSLCYAFNSWWSMAAWYYHWRSGEIINLLAAALFIVDSTSYFVAWYIRRRGWDMQETMPIVPAQPV